MRRRRNPEIIAGRVLPDGSIVSGDGFTVAKGAGGNYTLTFPKFSIISLVITPHNAANTAFYTGIGNISQVVQGITFANAGQDAGFSFIAVGIQQ